MYGSGVANAAILNQQDDDVDLLHHCNDRSSHQRCSIQKRVLRNFTKFVGKHLCKSLFFNKVAGLRPATVAPLPSPGFYGLTFISDTRLKLPYIE